MTGSRRGDIVLVWFPNSDLQTFKKRPAIVVQADEPDTGLPQIVSAMITSNLSRRGHPSRLFVPRAPEAGTATGLLTDSVIMTDNLATIRFEAVAQMSGHFSPIDGIGQRLEAHARPLSRLPEPDPTAIHHP